MAQTGAERQARHIKRRFLDRVAGLEQRVDELAGAR